MKKTLIVLVLLLSHSAFSQIKDLHFKRLSVENGLPENYATSLLQDKRGYIWFGTQNGLVRYDGYKVKVYNLNTPDKKDRPFRSIWSVIEDKKGVIWIATVREGIFRYNWSTDDFTQYQHSTKDTRKPKAETAYVLKEDQEGHIWALISDPAGKDMHLDRIDPKTGTFDTYDSVSNGNHHLPAKIFTVSSMKNSTADFWLGSNNGLFKFEYATKKFLPFFNATDEKASITNLYEAPSEPGILWLSVFRNNQQSFVRFDSKTKAVKTYRHQLANPKSLHCDTVLTVFEDKAKRLWLGTTNGLSLFDRKTELFTAYLPQDHLPDALANNCWNIKEGNNGELWILTTKLFTSGGYGLFHLPSSQSKLVRYQYDETKPYGLPSNSLNISFVDRNQNLWIGSRGNGLYRLDEKASQFETFQKTSEENSYPGGRLIASVRIGLNIYLLATRKGLFRYEVSANRYTPIPFSAEKKVQESLQSLMVDKTGIAWLGTRNDGLFRYDPKNNSTINFKNNTVDSLSLSNNFVSEIYEDREGNFWVGTWGGGLCQFDRITQKFQRYPFTYNEISAPSGVLDDDEVASILEDSKGVLWVGTNNGGLNRLDRNTYRFTSYHDNSKGFECVTTINEDSKGRMWVGTYLWGLFLFERPTGIYRRFTEKDGLVFDEVRLIKEDAAGKIWLGSPRGFSILDPVNFTIRTFTTANGLPQNDISSQAIFDMDGRWIVGTTNGYFAFQPQALIKDSTPPQVVLQTVSFTKIEGNADSTIILDDQKKIELAYNENRLNFSFVGLHYSNPELNEYLYKLDGYDKQWIGAGNQRFATYTNLPPGDYTFLVKAANSDHVWKKVPASLQIVIHPPWWRTWWSYALYVLVFGLALWTYISYRSKALRRQNKMLEDKVQHRTSQLQSSIENLKATQQQLIQSEKMASLGELTAGIAHEIQNPLNFVNNFSDVNSELMEELEDEIAFGNIEEVKAIIGDIKQNELKINYHGKRADAIVKGMLLHSRANTGKKEPTDINALVDEYLRLSYHGLRAKDKSFNSNFTKDFDESVGSSELIPQDIGRVLLNLFNNSFYSVNEKKKLLNEDYEPVVSVTTKRIHGNIQIIVRDNGIGIPQKVLDKIYQPFFTTKPTGQGTGLGLSMSYDIITKGHGGELEVSTKEGEFAEFIVKLPA